MNDKEFQTQAFHYFSDIYGYPVYLDSSGKALVPLRKKLHSDNWGSYVFDSENEARQTLSIAKSCVPISTALTAGGLALFVMGVRLSNTSEMYILPIVLIIVGLLLVNFSSGIDSHRLSQACENAELVNVRDITPKSFSNFIVIICGLLALFLLYGWLYLWIYFSIPISFLVFVIVVFIADRSLKMLGFTPFEKAFVRVSEDA